MDKAGNGFSCGYEAERENAQTESGRESFLPPFFF